VPETSYAPCGDLSLAYQVFGDGPIELVAAGSFASHVELARTLPEFEAFFDQLARFCRVLVFDKAGVSGCRTPCREFARSMIELPKSKPSWTPSVSERPSSSV